jgi:DNA repair protein RadC
MIVLKDTKIIASNGKVIAKVFQDLLAVEDTIDQDKEHFYVMHLDARNTVKIVEVVAIGIINIVLTHPREVFRRAIIEGSVNIIVAHNHPSQAVEPSDDDLQVTKRLHDAGDILGIQLLDHIIFTKDTYYSMKENH